MSIIKYILSPVLFCLFSAARGRGRGGPGGRGGRGGPGGFRGGRGGPAY